MSHLETTGRRRFLIAVVGLSSLTGCFGSTNDRPGTIDASDLSVLSNGSAEVTATNVQKDNDYGLKISTEDSVADGKVVSEIPISIVDASSSAVYVKADVEKLDDDAEVEIQFHSSTTYRSVLIGNEYKNQENGVLASETGSNYELREPFQKLPSPMQEETTQIKGIDRIQLVIRDGDFAGTIWALWFILEDMTITVL